MPSDQPRSKPRGDRMTTDFFEDVLAEYLAEDRIESGVVRVDLDDGRTRRVVVDDDTESLGSHEYVRRELEETIDLLEANDDLLEHPIELSIPVDDEERVIEEAEDGAVTTWFQPEGIVELLDHLRVALEEADGADGGAARAE